MDATSLADRLAVMRDAVEAASGFRDRLHEASGDTLGELVTLADTFASMGAQVRAAVVAEAVRRGEVETTMSAWVREHAPSLRQGGASQLARMVMEATKGGPTWTSQTHGPDPDSPTGIVWAAVQAVAPDLGREVDPEGGGEPDGIPADESTCVFDQPTATPLTAGNGLAVLSEMRVLEPQLQPEAVPTVTRVLVDLCRQHGPSHMRQLRPRLLAEYGKEGELDDLQKRLARGAFLSSTNVESGDLTEYRLALTPEQAATLEAAVGPLSGPAPNGETGEPDLRSAGQRRAEALIEICARAVAATHASAGEGPTGAYAAVHVTMTLADLRRFTGAEEAAPGSPHSVFTRRGPAADQDLCSGDVLGSRATGTLLSPEVLRRMACEADLIPHVLGAEGEHLDQGRETRLFDRAQRRQLMRRDKHCTYPGCDRPAAWTRAHHVLHWWDHGRSELDNAALLCERHHTIVHQRRLWADVRRTPDAHGRFVVWDLTEGSYDTELARRRAERAANDPPPLTPERWEAILRGLRSGDLAEQLWARHQAQWYDQGDEAFVPTFFDPRVWDAANDDSVA